MAGKCVRNRLPLRIAWVNFLMIFCLSASCSSPSITMRQHSPDKDPIAAFRKEVERLRKELNIPGISVAVLRQQRVGFAEGFGYADIESRIPAAANTPYHIASLSKPFAAAVLMKLVEKGLLNLDDAMADLLKDTRFPYGDGKIRG